MPGSDFRYLYKYCHMFETITQYQIRSKIEITRFSI